METLKGRIGLIVFCMLLSGGASGKIAPEQDRRTFHTEHFRIHYPSHYQEFSEILASRLEEAFTLLAGDFGWRPKSKTEVVIRGDIDAPNGFAEVFPYNRLVIHAVPPEPWGFFSESDDWIRTLAIHELTHIIANDETSGLFQVLSYVIGTAAKVNPYQPSWLVEGLAVFEETRLTQGGRGRSVWTDMVVRKSFEENLFAPGGTVSLDRLNDGIPYWPAGHTPYLFGYLLTRGIAAAAGKDAPFRISNLNSACFPFWVEGVAHEILGKGYSEVWGEVINRLGVEIGKDLSQIRETKTSEVTLLTSSGRRTRGYTEIKDGSLFIRDSKREGVGLTLLRQGVTKSLNEWRWDGGTRVRPTPEKNGAGYSRLMPYREHSLFSDLFYYDLDSNTETRLTEGSRAFDPDFSSDFRWNPSHGKITSGNIVFVKNLPDGNQALVLFGGEKEKTIYAGKKFERISTPVFGKNEYKEFILFSEKSRTEGEKLRAVNISSRETIDLTKPVTVRESVITPEWGEDGTILYSSSLGGVFNLYRISPGELRKKISGKSGVATRITNTTGGIIQPTLSKKPGNENEISGLVYGVNGFDIAKLSPAEQPSLSGPGLRTLDEKISHEKGEFYFSSASDLSAEMIPHDYSVLPALLPKYWAPDLRRDPDGWTLGIQTANADAWESHRYHFYAARDTRASFPLLDLNYQYDGLFPTFELSARQENRYFANYRESNRIRTNELKVWVPAGWDSNLILGGMASSSRFFGEEESNGGFTFGWNFRKMKVYDDSIDPGGESGIGFNTSLAGYFGDQERFSAVTSRFEIRVPSVLNRHFFRVAANYARSNNNQIEALYFLGGGEETLSASKEFLFRGYEPGTVYGREILTSNFEYQFPVVDIFRGWGTVPVYFQRARIKIFIDAASAEYVGADRENLHRWPLGAGVHFLSDFNLLYRVPVTIGIGFDRGFSRELGGENRIVIGLYSQPK